ncbi:GAF and ANTAR domain-containing protein [Aeromicrobium sp. CF3.5]|uniref:GAF and ANTAR domain-containing protein n=1 Tax=Aeromicrobium sp. CF3.5 TaxID=3373078 RepID=UPI003EE792E7
MDLPRSTRRHTVGEVDADTFFSHMALDLYDEPDADATVQRIAEYARIAVDCADVGIMLVHARRHIETAAATSSRVAESHDLQIVHDEGPCLDALDGDHIYSVPDTSKDPRWSTWGPAVHRLGMRSAVSVRLETRGRRYGSINLYGAEPHAFTEDDVAVATIFSRHASVAIAAAHNEDGLQVAIDARKLIGQAQGVLMERFDIDADRAFTFMRRQSQDHNTKLRDIAAWIVANRSTRSATYDPS